MATTAGELISEGKDITEHLTDSDKEQLQINEGIIDWGLKTFMEVGRAFAFIRDNRLYRETHKDWESYCRGRWDLSKRYADMQIKARETVVLLESKREQLFPFSIEGGEQSQEQPVEQCNDCEHRKGMANRKFKGVRIPGGSGKCTREGGLCEKQPDPNPAAGQVIVLPINEAQARPLTTLNNPDDVVKAWGLVLEKLNQNPKAKLTKSLVGKVVKEVRGEVAQDKLKKVKEKVNETSLVSNMFRKQIQVLLDIVSDQINNGWKDMKRTEAIKQLEAIINVISEA